MAKLQGCRIVVFLLFAATAIAAPAQTYTVLYAFQGGTDGSQPQGPLTFDSQGNIYGASQDANVDWGAIFQLSPTGVKTILYSFKGGEDGNGPNGGLLLDAAGNLYGTTVVGGNISQNCDYGCGTVFKLSPSGVKTTLYEFNGVGGEIPSAIISDSLGNLYGTTQRGGSNGLGTVYQLTLQPNGTYTHKVIYQMNKYACDPYDAPTFDAKGNLYVTTYAGRNTEITNVGTLLKLTRNANGTWVHSLHDFNWKYKNPEAKVIIDAAGNIYGTTTYGSSGYTDGSAWEKVAQTGKFIALHTFSGNDAGPPGPPLTLDSAGNLYGEMWGGLRGNGTVFKLNPYTVLYSFQPSDLTPLGGLVVDSSGNLYGVTAGDGMTSYGSVFELQP
jgi:uncharacterized repeat protein (TIGR03803 family)